MCRHLAYVGRPRVLRELLLDPPHSLRRQSWAPRWQRPGTVNADGFGVGWYVPDDPVPARFRSDRPMWSDLSLPDLARVTTSHAALASVRDATPGMPYGVGAVAPFGFDRYLFSHNGWLADWPASAATFAVDPVDLVDLGALTDSTLLWATTCRYLEAGASPELAMRELVARAAKVGGRLNFLLTDATTIAATAWGNSLFWIAVPDGVVVASEPYDDDPQWTEVPDRSLLLATSEGVRVDPLTDD